MPPIDLDPAAESLATLVGEVRDDQLGDPTPCTDLSIADLLDHIAMLGPAFTAAARKALGELTDRPPPPADGSRLAVGWRERIGHDLRSLAGAWRDPDAWTGMTRAGGVDLPGEVAGLVALDELVLHGWDLAMATGQRFVCDDGSLRAVQGFVEQFSGDGHDEERQGLFGPELPVPADAPLLTRVLGMAGRDADWTR
jgi:uncharacterized protein (TIGR03086 family)